MPSFNHNARSMATSILSHSSSLASCTQTSMFNISLHLNYLKLLIFFNSVTFFYTCSHAKGPLSLNDWQKSDPCWMLISVSMKMEVRNNRLRCREEHCKVWVCSLRYKDEDANGIVTITFKKLYYYNALPSSPCSSGKSVFITLRSIVRVGKMAP